MKLGKICRTVLLALSLSGCGRAPDSSRESSVPEASERLLLNSRTGELEGFEAINTLIQNRLLDPAAPANANFAIEAVGGPGILELSEMLGSYGTDGDRNDFLNGEPNPFNVMLWQNQFGLLAQTLGRACAESGTMDGLVILPGIESDLAFQFNAQVLSILQRLCLLPLEKSQDPEDLEKLWLQVIRYDAPQEEALAWLDFLLLNHDPSWTTRADRMSAAFFTMFMNPYFILQE